MDGLILISDSFALPKSTVQRMHWSDKNQQLEIVFNDPALIETTVRVWKLTREEAFAFWEQYTGERVSWDTRPLPEFLGE